MNHGLSNLIDKSQQSITLKKKGYVEVFKVRINYNSGIQEEFWCSEFKVDSLGTYSWKPLFGSIRPLILNVDNIESIYQVALEYVSKKELSKCEIDIDFEDD